MLTKNDYVIIKKLLREDIKNKYKALPMLENKNKAMEKLVKYTISQMEGTLIRVNKAMARL